MRVIGWTVGIAVALLGAVYVVNLALDLVSSADDGAVFVGVALLGVLTGVLLLAVMKWHLRVTPLLKRAGILAVLMMAVGCTTVPAGYVGVKVNQWGTQRGVDDLPVTTGRVLYNPMSTDIYKFPTFNQIVVWDADSDGDNDNGNEAISFRSAKQAQINADVSVNFHIDSGKVQHIFLEFRQDLLSLERGYIRGRVQNYFTQVAGQMDTFDILGPRMGELIDQVRANLKKELDTKGIIIDTVSILGAPRVDQSVQNAINTVIQQQLAATTAEQKVRQIQMEGLQNVARAEATAKAQIAEAEGVARAMILRSDAEAESNRKVAASITDAYIRYRMLDVQRQWDGKLPGMMGIGATPFIDVNQPR